MRKYIKNDDGKLLREAGLIRARWVAFFHAFFSTKSGKLDLTNHVPVLGAERTMTQEADAVRTMGNGRRWDRTNYRLG